MNLGPLRRFVNQHALLMFLLGTFALSWAPGVFGPRSVFPFAPFLIALAILAAAGGRSEIGAFLRKVVQWRVSLRWYAFVLGAPPLLTLSAVGVNVLLGSPAPTWNEMPSILGAAPTFVLIFLFIGIGEEPAWRGFALPRLTVGRPWIAGALALGVVHVAWHAPLFGTEYSRGQVLPWALAVVAYSVVTAWMRPRTSGNLLLPALFHTSVGTSAYFLFNPLFNGAALDRLYWAWGLLWCALALTIVASALRSPSLARGNQTIKPALSH